MCTVTLLSAPTNLFCIDTSRSTFISNRVRQALLGIYSSWACHVLLLHMFTVSPLSSPTSHSALCLRLPIFLVLIPPHFWATFWTNLVPRGVVYLFRTTLYFTYSYVYSHSALPVSFVLIRWDSLHFLHRSRSQSPVVCALRYSAVFFSNSYLFSRSALSAPTNFFSIET